MKLFIVLHHSDIPDQAPQFNRVNESHKRRGFPISSLGWNVGYHYFIGFDGFVKQARKEEEVGAHCNAKMMNYIGIGICLAGDFTQHDPNPTQIVALETLLMGIQNRWNMPDEAILLHRECKPTSCPGIDLRSLALMQRKRKQTERDLARESNPTLRRMLIRRMARIVKWLGK